MIKRALLSLVLADERVDDVEHGVIGDRLKDKNLWNSAAEAIWIRLKANRIVNASHRQSMETPDGARQIVIQERRNVDDLRHVRRDQRAHVRASPDAFALLAELKVAVNEFSDQRCFVEMIFIEASFQR